MYFAYLKLSAAYMCFGIGLAAPEAIRIFSGYLNLQNRAENWGTYLGSVKAKAMAIYLDT